MPSIAPTSDFIASIALLKLLRDVNTCVSFNYKLVTYFYLRWKWSWYYDINRTKCGICRTKKYTRPSSKGTNRLYYWTAGQNQWWKDWQAGASRKGWKISGLSLNIGKNIFFQGIILYFCCWNYCNRISCKKHSTCRSFFALGYGYLNYINWWKF